MKARWMKSVVKHSKETAPTLPYHRARRQERRHAALFDLLRELRSA
jgi:hypothetical protein